MNFLEMNGKDILNIVNEMVDIDYNNGLYEKLDDLIGTIVIESMRKIRGDLYRLTAGTWDKGWWKTTLGGSPLTNYQIPLGKAFNNFFKGKGKHPVFHKKGINDGFYISNDKADFREGKIRLPKIGLVKIREQLRFDGKIMSFTIKREANQWYVCVSVQMTEIKTEDTNKKVTTLQKYLLVIMEKMGIDTLNFIEKRT